MKTSCYHCGENVPNSTNLYLVIESTSQPMCCVGCHSVAQTIVDNGLEEYYRFRTEPAQKGEQLI